MKVLITGVSGFVGQRLARHLQGRGHQVSGTYIHGAPGLPGVEAFEVDLRNAARLSEIVERTSPEVVVHLAGLSHVGASWSQPAEYFRVNVMGTENLLRAASGIRLLAASSAEVYGNVPEAEQPIPEERPPAPESPYALTKAAMERLVLAWDAIVVRAFNIVGPGQAASFALPAFAAQLARAWSQRRPQPVLKVGNLAARRDFLHVDDAVIAYERLLGGAEPGRIYNLGSSTVFSIEEALGRLIKVSGVAPRVEVDPERFRPVDLPLLRADNRSLRALGWEATKSLDDALRDLWRVTLEGYRESPAADPGERLPA